MKTVNATAFRDLPEGTLFSVKPHHPFLFIKGISLRQGLIVVYPADRPTEGLRIDPTIYSAEYIVFSPEETTAFRDHLTIHLKDGLPADCPPMTHAEEWQTRVQLALMHEQGKCTIDHANGELRCTNIERHGRVIDFRRESIGSLLSILRATDFKESGVIVSDHTPAEAVAAIHKEEQP